MATWIKTEQGGWVRKGAAISTPEAPTGGYGKTPYGKKYGK
jgi:hypothetical protein